MNRKGDERTLSFYWIIIFVIVAVGLISGIVVFFSHPLDVRSAEGNIMMDKIVQCISDDGELIDGILDKINSEGFGVCGVFLDNVDGEEDFYLELNINGEIVSNEFSSLQSLCVTESERNRPDCFSRKLFFNNGEELIVGEISVAVGKVRQNAV